MADFIAEFINFGEDEIPDHHVELAKEGEAEEKDSNTTRWKVFVEDGSSNHSGCGAGLILQTPSGEQMEYVYALDLKPPTMKQSMKLSSSD